MVRRSQHAPMLGTTVELKIEAMSDRRARRIERTIVAEIARLERVFTVFDESSDLSRYRRGEFGPFAPELMTVLADAERWRVRGGGAFNPGTGALTAVWAEAAETGEMPESVKLRAIADELAGPVDSHRHRSTMNLNAIAKGWIVDAAVKTGVAAERTTPTVTLSAGGDLLHGGDGRALAGVENPHRPFSNAEPLDRIVISNEAMATSGSAHRWFEVGGIRRSQVIDPRTGQPADRVASASVVASNVAEADVLATILTVIGPDEAEAAAVFADRPWMTVDRDGAVRSSSEWRARSLGPNFALG